VAPKKHAIARGIEASESEIVIITDADCRVGPCWIKGLTSHFQPDVGIVLGFTNYRRDPGVGRLLYGIQTLEFLSHVFCAAGAVGVGKAFNSNANNLAYRRAAYREVGGFSTVGEYLSGDDDLLLQAVAGRTRWRVDFAVEPETYIQTRPTASVAGMVRQRMRWASKWDAYSPTVITFMVSTFIFFLGLFFTLPLSLTDPVNQPVPLILFGLKTFGDFAVMYRGIRLFRVRGLLRFFPLVELIHIPLILTAAVGGQFATHQWRGRRLSRKV
jgi:cellulose synthase/poly-beta-1,6-N-acetylglucosamine synthase-like glycosyltransferase